MASFKIVWFKGEKAENTFEIDSNASNLATASGDSEESLSVSSLSVDLGPGFKGRRARE